MNENKSRRLLSLLLVVLMLVTLLPMEGFSEVVKAATGPSISTQPKNQTVGAGETATFTVAATGTGTLSYRWQSRKDGSADWTNSGQSGANTKTLSVTTNVGLNGWQFRCLVTDGNGAIATSKTAVLSIVPNITKQPTDNSVAAGETATFSVSVTAKATVSYQWQSRKDSASSWVNSGQSGARSATLSVATNAGLNGYQFRCIVTDGNNQKTTSNVATLNIVPKITTQPKDASVNAGQTAKFTVAASGKATITYQWQSRKDSSAAWVNSGQSGARTATLSVATNAGLNGYQFRCIVTDGNGQKTYSDTAILYTSALKITSQPSDVSANVGSKAIFKVAATGTGTLTYQWQSRKDSSSAWANSEQSGAKTKQLSVATKAGINGWQFRCIVKDASGYTFASEYATLTVTAQITQQPSNQTVTEGETAKFTVAATGAPTLHYQWQFRKNASSAWANSGQNGAKTATLSVATNAGLNGYQFQCIITDGNGKKLTTNTVSLSVEPEVTDYVTYKQFGAKGDGKTNDYAAIVATHAYANEHNLPVKADKGAVYYVDKMDASNPKGAIIKTNTDWTGAEFFIDDSKLEIESYYFDKDSIEAMHVTYPKRWDGRCFLFTVEPSIVYEKTWINFNVWWRINNGKWAWYYEGAKQDGDIKIYLGVDSSVGTFSNPQYISNPTTAYNMKNKSFTKDTTKLEGTFNEKALYSLKTESVKRWGRFGWGNANSSCVPQEETIIVNKDGTIDPLSTLQWDWDKISTIQKSYIDEKQLTVKGGKFTTKVNKMWDSAYIYRGISIERSNVLIEGVEHYLTGEEAEYTKDSFGYSSLFKRDDVFPRYGAPYQGFFRLDHCAYVTLKDCVFSNRHRVFYIYKPSTGKWNNDSSTASYDFYAEYCVGITLDGCKSAKTIDYEPDYVKGLLGLGPVVPAVYDVTESGLVGIMDDLRWGVTGTNYCKSLVVQNGCEINRIDAHKGTYGLTVTDSTLGHYGVAVVGFGKLKLNNVKIYSEYLVNLRRDFGSAWYGDVEIDNVYWNLGKCYTPTMFFASYLPDKGYGYDTIDSGKKYSDGKPYLYYSQLPTNISVNNLTIDATGVTSTALFTSGLAIFTNPFASVKKTINDTYLMNRASYMFPLKPTENIQLSNITVIKNPSLANTSFTKVVKMREDTDYHAEYFFKDTQMNEVKVNLITSDKK